MPARDPERILHELENQADDELALLESTGTEFYSTGQLLRLRGQWEVKNHLFRLFQKWLIRLMAFSPVWVLGWLIFSVIGWRYLATLSLMLFPVTFAVVLGGLLFFRRFFRGKGHLDQVGSMIYDELQKRSRAS